MRWLLYRVTTIQRFHCMMVKLNPVLKAHPLHEIMSIEIHYISIDIVPYERYDRAMVTW